MYMFESISNSLSKFPQCHKYIFLEKLSSLYINDLHILFTKKLELLYILRFYFSLCKVNYNLMISEASSNAKILEFYSHLTSL